MCYLCLVDSSLRALQTALDQAQRIFCVSHPSADGDAVGSLCGVAHILRAQGKAVALALPDQPPAYLSYVPGWTDILSWADAPEAVAAAAQSADLFFALDFGKWDRLPAPLVQLLDPDRLVWVDHHADSEPLSHRWNFWDPAAAATTQILCELLSQLYEFPLAGRIALYVGLVTDTGGFRFRSVTPSTLQVAANLIAPPFPLEVIHHYIFQRKKVSQLRLQSYLFQHHFEKLQDLPVRLVIVPAAVLAAHEATWEDIHTLANQVLALEDTLLAIVVKEYPTETRLSIRGLGDFPCHELAASFDKGGGHRNAAGASLYKPLSEAVVHLKNVIHEKYADQIRMEYATFCAKLELQAYS